VRNPPTSEYGEATPGASTTTPSCLHCGEDLALDDIWGWVHADRRYLCVDPVSGETLCSPATII
jgi:hypothetical protein